MTLSESFRKNSVMTVNVEFLLNDVISRWIGKDITCRIYDVVFHDSEYEWMQNTTNTVRH